MTAASSSSVLIFSLRKLSDGDLDVRIKKLGQQERQLIREIVESVLEVDRRRLHLTFGFPSLHAYLTEGSKYSEGSAQRFIDAARLLSDVPELAEKLEQGQVTLSQVAVIQKSVRQVRRETDARISKEQKQELVAMISKCTLRQSEQLVAQVLETPVKENTKMRPQADKSVRVEVTLSKSQFERMNEARGLLAHIIPDGDLATMLDYLWTKEIHQRTKTARKKHQTTLQEGTRPISETKNPGQELNLKQQDEVTTNVVAITKIQNHFRKKVFSFYDLSRDRYFDLPDQPKNSSTANITSAVTPMTTSPKQITPSIRRKILERDRCCAYTDARTGKRCETPWALQVDHIQPRWDGGRNDEENLQLLCKAHNQQRYRENVGIRRC